MTGRPVPMGRGRAVAAAIVAVASLMTISPAQACACGGMVDQQGFDTTVNGETAVIVWDGSTEIVTVRLDATSEATDAGLLVPTPAPAEAALGDNRLIEDLWQHSLPRREERVHWFGPPALFGGAGGDGTAGAPEAGGQRPGVQVLSVQDLGPLEATILTADDPEALDTWLVEHDYQMSDAFSDLVTPYIDEGWAFAAVRLTTEGQALDGQLPPIELTFPSDQAVYPMRMSRGAQVAQQTRTYLLAQHRMERTDRSADEAGGASTTFAGLVDPLAVTSPVLRPLLEDTPYLTTIDQAFPTPARQVLSDFTFAPAADDTPYQQVIYTDTYRVPIDVAILALAFAVLLLGGLAAIVRNRRTPTLASRRIREELRTPPR